ncbi:hypothetical protein DEO72_LG8g1865 [Vigna unguiculata]|uniref:Uncharacterized protein n=1 Tax=Vigna unguiculata TaxID=3917 RepID=A0A4D6MQQ0_VIGUN|nr:hypothetical protein DEO72_LG8g1865 [Vigna unguiculata]
MIEGVVVDKEVHKEVKGDGEIEKDLDDGEVDEVEVCDEELDEEGDDTTTDDADEKFSDEGLVDVSVEGDTTNESWDGYVECEVGGTPEDIEGAGSSSQRQCSNSHEDELRFPLTDFSAAHHVDNLSTILVASIQDAKDRIAQIEYVFCSQLYPQLKSDATSKRHRTNQLQREVDENMALHKNLVELVQSKVSALRNAEEK